MALPDTTTLKDSGSAVSPTGGRSFRLSGAHVLLLAATVSIALASFRASHNDFDSFYDAAVMWRTNAPSHYYGHPNLNPPTFTLLFSALTIFPLAAATTLWMLLSAVAFADALRLIRAHLKLSPNQTFILACLGFVLQPASIAWQEGQVTWILLWLVTRAWTRRSSPWPCGVWLGCAIALKPPLALMAVALPLEVIASSCAVTVILTLATVLVTGLQPWRDWLALSRTITWLPQGLNISFWGVAARWQAHAVDGVGIADLRPLTIGGVLVLGLAAWLVAVRQRDDRRWLLAGLVSVALSPLGWAYYLPVFAGPIVACRPVRRSAAWVSLLVFSPASALILLLGVSDTYWLGFLNTVGALALWLAYLPRPSELLRSR